VYPEALNSAPIVDNAMAEGRRLNRRVTLIREDSGL
jgi:outer membrane protein OmpA-like peptidoglycan-associated protein